MVFKPRGRDIDLLKQTFGNDFSFLVVEGEDNFVKIVKEHIVSCIIVPLGTEKEGSDHAREFAKVASKYLQPEDSDICIIHSSEYSTPESWPGALDPRPARNMQDPILKVDDKRWQHTIVSLKELKTREVYSRPKAKDTVIVEVNDSREVPFISETESILRAAFKDMQKIIVKFPLSRVFPGLQFVWSNQFINQVDIVSAC